MIPIPVYDQVKQALQDILTPEIQALKAEIKRLDERIAGLEEKMNARISGLEAKMSARLSALEEKTDARREGLRQEMVAQTQRLEERIRGVEEKMSSVEGKISGVEGRISGVEGKLESLRNEILAEIQRVEGKVDNVRNELLAEIRRVDATMDGLGPEVRTALEIRERLAALEAKVGITRPQLSRPRRQNFPAPTLEREKRGRVDPRIMPFPLYPLGRTRLFPSGRGWGRGLRGRVAFSFSGRGKAVKGRLGY